MAVVSCSQPSFQDKAISIVRHRFPECEKILSVQVDTITFGMNLDYRINQFEDDKQMAEREAKEFLSTYKEFVQMGGRSVAQSYKDHSDEAKNRANWYQLVIDALDSLKLANTDILDTPTAYQYCIAYNYPSNLVWVQLAADGTLLKVSSSLRDMLLNPGDDVPGYYDLIVSMYNKRDKENNAK